MNKKIVLPLFILSLPLSFLSGCSVSATRYIKDVSYKIDEGKALISFVSEGFKKYHLYERNKGEEQYQFVSILNENQFTSNDLRKKEYKVIGLYEGKEDLKFQLEIKTYFDGVFDNEHVKIFFEDDDHQQIQQYVDDKYQQLNAAEWATDRMEILFMPGDYSDISLKTGYYTSIKGLGYSPDDCNFKSLLTMDHPGTGNALINFWRSIENLSFNEKSFWAVSQATSIRHSHFKDDLYLFDYNGSGNHWSSGGFIANSYIEGDVIPGSQQQYLMRNDKFQAFTGANYNMVFEGSIGEMPMADDWVESRSTILEQSLDVYEKPFLVFDNQKGFGYMVSNQKSTQSGYNWSLEALEFVPLSEFKVINPNKSAKEIKDILNNNARILFTPGIYDIDEQLDVNLDNSFIAGMGYATLSATANIEKTLSVKSVNNKIFSLLFQSEVNITNYLVLEENNNNEMTLLSDLFFRVGGHSEKDIKVDTCLVINQNYVIGDNFWIWRADHGKNIGYTKNYARLGCVINGHNVICHALMVEHFYEYQVIFNGEDNKVIFYQSETPYDIPGQAYWMRYEEGYTGEAAIGYPSYKVNDNVRKHTGYGIGIYYINTLGITQSCYTALETPRNNDIYFLHVTANYFGGEGKFMHTINDILGTRRLGEADRNSVIELFDKDHW